MDDSTDVSTELVSTTNEISCSQDCSLNDGFCEFKLHVSIRHVQFHREEQLKIKENGLELTQTHANIIFRVFMDEQLIALDGLSFQRHSLLSCKNNNSCQNYNVKDIK